MARLTKVTSLAASIIRQMNGIGRWQEQFLLHLFPLWLSIRGRYNFVNLARYGDFNEGTYRKNFSKAFDWLTFNRILVEQYMSQERIIALDPSYVSKSGKHSAGVGYFWSGAAGQAKWGQELCGLAAVDLCDKTAMHLLAVQTMDVDVENPLDYFASIIEINAEQLRKVSDYVVVDAFFAKACFVDKVMRSGFHVITRLRKDQVMYYPYSGPRQHRRGAPKKYDGRIDPQNLREDKFRPCARGEDGSWMAFEATAYVKAWKLWCRIIIIHNYDKAGKMTGYAIMASTDKSLDGGQVKLCYECRYQQEFLFRDAKQELGLEDGQAYSWQKIDFHFNAALTVGSLAKAAHHLTPKQANDQPFSIADVKTAYVNESIAWRIISGCGICPDLPIIRKLIPEIKRLGRRRA